MSRAGADDGHPPTSGEGRAVRRALRWYLLWSLVVLVIVGVGVVLLSGVLVRSTTLRDATRTAQAIADTIVLPLATESFHEGNPSAVDAMTQALELRSRDGSLEHVRLWEEAGPGEAKILWADQPDIIGMTFPMANREFSLFGTNNVVASVSDLEKAENAFDQESASLVEVYTGVRDSTGAHLLFESYIPTERLSDDTQALTVRLLPISLGALLILSLTTLPLAVSLARRVDRAQEDRRRLLTNAVNASDLERRRIAQDLHDGVIQDLAGVGYSLSSLAKQVPGGSSMGPHLNEAAAIVRRDVSALRTLMTDIYPPDLDTRGLAEAIRDLLSQEAFARMAVTYDVDEPLTPSDDTARLAFRVVREALRNVVKHAGATSLSVRVGQHGTMLLLEVADDGVGFDPQGEGPDGHLGLRLIQDTVVDSGGTLAIDSAPGKGTVVRGSLPL